MREYFGAFLTAICGAGAGLMVGIDTADSAYKPLVDEVCKGGLVKAAERTGFHLDPSKKGRLEFDRVKGLCAYKQSDRSKLEYPAVETVPADSLRKAEPYLGGLSVPSTAPVPCRFC